MSNVPGVMNVPGANDLANLRLLVDEDGDYSFGATSIAPSSFNNATGMVYFEHDFVAGNILPLTQNRGFFFTLGTTDHTTTPLPVEMEEFTVKSNNCSLNLNWVTNTESQIDYYLLEYSTDGSNWNELKTVEPKGSENFSNAYSESIQHTTIGLQYIRISEIDTDGNQRLLDTKSIVHKCTTEDCINLYPNPTIGTVNVTGCNWESIEFFDNNVRMVKSERYNGQTVLDVSNLVSGTYMIRVMLDDNRIEFKKLIIQ